MSGILSAADLRGVVAGGERAMAALERRIATGRGQLGLELYQVADRATVDAIAARARSGDPVSMLADARLDGGGYAEELVAATRGGSARTYGPDPAWFQHAKVYHFSDDGPEAWITNLAPIPDTLQRSELSVVVGGDAASAAREVLDASVDGAPRRIQAAIDAAAGYGVLVNDPLARRARLTEGLRSVLSDGGRGDVLVITKGIQDRATTDALVAAHGSGRDVAVYVRDLASADGERLSAAGVPTWIVGGGLKPRINAVFTGDRGVVGSAFLWDHMVGTGSIASSRDVGVHVAGAPGRALREAALATMRSLPTHTPVEDALRGGLLLDAI